MPKIRPNGIVWRNILHLPSVPGRNARPRPVRWWNRLHDGFILELGSVCDNGSFILSEGTAV